jgi:short-subunit dehydrogenase
MTTTLVTGASAGLGEGFARALAKNGHDLILTARRADRLEALATDLRRTHGATIHVFTADLGDPEAPAELITRIEAAGLTIDTLINNAGFGLQGAVADLDGGKQAAIIDVNCRALVILAHAVLPAMIARGKGAILNIASTAAFQPGPMFAVYSASKAFVLSFSEALHEEVKPHGVSVAALCPGPTNTEFAEVAGMGHSLLFDRFAGGPDAVIRDGLAALKANQAVKISGAMNFLMAESIRFAPRGMVRRFAHQLQKGRT